MLCLYQEDFWAYLVRIYSRFTVEWLWPSYVHACRCACKDILQYVVLLCICVPNCHLNNLSFWSQGRVEAPWAWVSVRQIQWPVGRAWVGTWRTGNWTRWRPSAMVIALSRDPVACPAMPRHMISAGLVVLLPLCHKCTAHIYPHLCCHWWSCRRAASNVSCLLKEKALCLLIWQDGFSLSG